MKYEEIYNILKKHELERFYDDNKMIPRYNYPKLISEILEAINYSQCCETLNNKKTMDFDEYIEYLGIKKINNNCFVKDGERILKKELWLKHLNYINNL